jgi:hypothetical protein
MIFVLNIEVHIMMMCEVRTVSQQKLSNHEKQWNKILKKEKKYRHNWNQGLIK